MFSLYRSDSTLYAGGKDVVYISKNKGQSWDSTTHLPGSNLVDAIIVYRNELYAGCYSLGVYKSRNGGISWENVGAGIVPYVSGFCEWRGNLYASTLGGGLFKLDSVGRSSWVSFNTGLSSLSANINTVAGNNNALIAGTLANRLYDRLGVTDGAWDERFIVGNNNPADGITDIVVAHDSLFMATYNLFYYSTDDGLTWHESGHTPPSRYTTLLNAKQAIIMARNALSGGINKTFFYYIRKDSLRESVVPFSTVSDHFTYRMEILGNKLWDAGFNGLYYMSLSNLPGITSANEKDTVAGGGDPGGPVNYPFTVGLIYPNPVAGSGRLDISLDTAKTITAFITDVSGKLVSAPVNHLSLPKGKTTLSFGMGNVSSGVYFLRLSINDKIITRKMIHINP